MVIFHSYVKLPEGNHPFSISGFSLSTRRNIFNRSRLPSWNEMLRRLTWAPSLSSKIVLFHGETIGLKVPKFKKSPYVLVLFHGLEWLRCAPEGFEWCWILMALAHSALSGWFWRDFRVTGFHPSHWPVPGVQPGGEAEGHRPQAEKSGTSQGQGKGAAISRIRASRLRDQKSSLPKIKIPESHIYHHMCIWYYTIIY